MRFLLDTDHISVLQWQGEPHYSTLTARMAAFPRSDFVVSIVSFHEQTRGCHTYLSRAVSRDDVIHGYELLERVRQEFIRSHVLQFDDPAADAAAALKSQRVRLRASDLRIASIALSRGLTLLTRNARDFSRVPGLQFEDWTV